MWDPYAEFRSETLPNGLTVHAAHWPNRPFEAVSFLVHSGAEQDPVGLEGLAHFVEHTISENGLLPKKAVRAFFENRGGKVGLGRTSFACTEYNFFAPADLAMLRESFSMFGYMLIAARIVNSVEQERKVILGEFDRHFPDRIKLELERHERAALYADCWLGRFLRPLGEPASIARIAQSDLQSFYGAHYAPANMSIVAVGGMELAQIVELVAQSSFAKQKAGARTPLPEPMANTSLPTETRHVFVASERIAKGFSSDTGGLRIVARIPGDIDLYAIRLFCRMLNETLTDEVREHRAWTYHIGCTPYNYRHFRQISICCDALKIEAMDEIEGVVEQCLSQLRASDDLLEQAKRCIVQSMSLLDPTGKGIRNDVVGELADYHRIITLEEAMAMIEKKNMDDIRAILPWLEPARRWTLLARP